MTLRCNLCNNCINRFAVHSELDIVCLEGLSDNWVRRGTGAVIYAFIVRVTFPGYSYLTRVTLPVSDHSGMLLLLLHTVVDCYLMQERKACATCCVALESAKYRHFR